MLVTYDGIVIARREIGESNVFIDILTDEQGVIEACANGANKITSSILSASALFSYSTFCLSKTKLRYNVNSALPKYTFHEIGNDITRLALASYFAQSVKSCTPREQPQESIVRFFAIALYEVLNGKSLRNVKSAFELRYSVDLGFSPNLIGCDSCGGYDSPEGMFFQPEKSRLLCGGCSGDENGIRLLPETLFAMRNIVFSPLERAFKFNVSENAERQLGEICEQYFLNRVERSFPTLSYYKRLQKPF